MIYEGEGNSIRNLGSTTLLRLGTLAFRLLERISWEFINSVPKKRIYIPLKETLCVCINHHAFKKFT